jgi:hypothetical protein
VNSVGDELLPAQLATSFGAPNPGPRVGPVVLREIHYHPAPGGDEFVELANVSASSVPLFDPARPTNTWRLNGLGFDFPTNVTLAPGATALLVATNPAAFRARYSVPAQVIILGPYSGDLQDSGERLRLERPEAPDTNGVPYSVVDEVRYNDKAPWPPAADGSGASLHRAPADAFGDDPAAWTASTPSPGTEDDPGDTDGDGLPDAWESANGTNPFFPDANGDPDGDGLTNAEEYAAGTHPNQAASSLRVEVAVTGPDRVTLSFTRAPQRAYRVLYKNSLSDPAWAQLATVTAADTEGGVEITDILPPATRFYRVVTP